VSWYAKREGAKRPVDVTESSAGTLWPSTTTRAKKPPPEMPNPDSEVPELAFSAPFVSLDFLTMSSLSASTESISGCPGRLAGVESPLGRRSQERISCWI
jgi:hypothetical protein